MKLVSFAVPCYNSAAYMNRCVDSLLVGGNDVEILIVNDGSSDDTAKIADEYEKKYPSIIKAIHKENGGHGSAVNIGLENATGLYYKVVDSDDWMDIDAMKAYIANIKELVQNEQTPDVIITNYVYEHVEDNSCKVMRYNDAFPVGRIVSWSETKSLRQDQHLIMHAVTYRRRLLTSCGLKLPEHTFYVDNIYVYYPQPYVKSIYYMDIDLYRYFIGRSDQSVNETVMVSRVDQQLKITYIMIDSHDLSKIKEQNKVLYKNMFSAIAMMISVTTVFLYIANTPESIEKKNKLWEHVKNKDVHLYRMLKYFSLNIFTILPGYQGRKFTVSLYRIVRKIYKFN